MRPQCPSPHAPRKCIFTSPGPSTCHGAAPLYESTLYPLTSLHAQPLPVLIDVPSPCMGTSCALAPHAALSVSFAHTLHTDRIVSLPPDLFPLNVSLWDLLNFPSLSCLVCLVTLCLVREKAPCQRANAICLLPRLLMWSARDLEQGWPLGSCHCLHSRGTHLYCPKSTSVSWRHTGKPDDGNCLGDRYRRAHIVLGAGEAGCDLLCFRLLPLATHKEQASLGQR